MPAFKLAFARRIITPAIKYVSNVDFSGKYMKNLKCKKNCHSQLDWEWIPA